MTNSLPPNSDRTNHADSRHEPTGLGRKIQAMAGEVKHGGFDFRQFRHSVQERLWIVVLCVIAGLFLALGYLARTPKMYQGHVVLEVDVEEAAILPTADQGSRMRSMFLASQDAMRTIEQSFG